MTDWSIAMIWSQLRAKLITIPGCLTAIAMVLVSPEASTSEMLRSSADLQIAAYHTSPTTPSFQSPPAISEGEARRHITEAKRLLKELQAFIEETARTVELDNLVKIRKQDNERLKKSLSSGRAARTIIESEISPMEHARSALTRAIVKNWLDTVQLNYRVDEAERTLIDTEKAWSKVERRATELRRVLVTRRAEIRSLKRETAALTDELDLTRRQVTRANAETRMFEHQQGLITAATAALRRDLTSKLRRALLGSEH